MKKRRRENEIRPAFAQQKKLKCAQSPPNTLAHNHNTRARKFNNGDTMKMKADFSFLHRLLLAMIFDSYII